MRFESTHPGKPAREPAVSRCIKQFEETGQSGMHSPHGHLLSHLLNHCRVKRIGFTLTSSRTGFYFMERLEE